jgi:hypothetical protein
MARRRLEMHHYRQALVRMRQGDSDRDIAAARVMGRRMAARLRELAHQHGWLDAANALPEDQAITAALGQPKRARSTVSTLEAHRERIQAWVEQGVGGVAMWAALKREHGYSGSYSAVRRMLVDVRGSQPVEATCRLHFDPAEAAQVDFGAGPMLQHPDGTTRRTWAFVMTLCFSAPPVRGVRLGPECAYLAGLPPARLRVVRRRARARHHRQRQVRHHQGLRTTPPCSAPMPSVPRATASRSTPARRTTRRRRASSSPASSTSRATSWPLRSFRDLADLNAQAAPGSCKKPGSASTARPGAARWSCSRWSARCMQALPAIAPDLGTWHRVTCTGTATSSSSAPVLGPLHAGGQDAVAARHRWCRALYRGLPPCRHPSAASCPASV